MIDTFVKHRVLDPSVEGTSAGLQTLILFSIRKNDVSFWPYFSTVIKCVLSSASFMRKVRISFVALVVNKLLDNKDLSIDYSEFFIRMVTRKNAKITCFPEQRSASQEYLEHFSA